MSVNAEAPRITSENVTTGDTYFAVAQADAEVNGINRDDAKRTKDKSSEWSQSTELTAEEYDQRIEALERIRKSQKTVEGLAKAIGSSPEEVRNYINRNDFRNVFALARVMQQHEATSLDELDQSFWDEYGDFGTNSQKYDEKDLHVSENGDILSGENSQIRENGSGTDMDSVVPESEISNPTVSEPTSNPIVAQKTVDHIEYSGRKKQIKLIYYTDGTAALENKGNIVYGLTPSVLDYCKRDRKLYHQMRREFNQKYCGLFVQELVKNHLNELLALGFTKDQIDGMRQGKSPKGYEVHHIDPLDDSGENVFSNFVLIHKDPHRVFSNHQMSFCKSIKVGESETRLWLRPQPGIFNMETYLKGESENVERIAGTSQ